MENQTFKSFPPQVVEILRQIPDRRFITNIPDGKRMTSVSSLFFRQVMDAAFGCNGWEIKIEKRELTTTFCWKNKKDKSGQVISKEEGVLYVATCIGRLVIPQYEFVSAEMMGVDDGDNAAYAIRGAVTNLMKTCCISAFGVAASERKKYFPPNYYIAQGANGTAENPPYPFEKPTLPAAPTAAIAPESSSAPTPPQAKAEKSKVQVIDDEKKVKIIATNAVVASIKARVETATTPKEVNDLRDKSLKVYDFNKKQIGVLKDVFTEGRLRTVKETIKKHAAARDFGEKQWAKLEDFCKIFLADYMDELSVLIMEASSYLDSMPQAATATA